MVNQEFKGKCIKKQFYMDHQWTNNRQLEIHNKNNPKQKQKYKQI